MSAKRSGLGRGLDALLPKSEKGVEQVELSKLSVSAYQPRKYLDPEAIAELADSIAEKGVIQPLVVRPLADGYEIVAGERRFRAAKQAGLSTVPALVREFSDRETLEIAIVENLQREDLSDIEEARAFKQLMDFGLSQAEVGKAVGKSRSAIANTLRLLKLNDKALAALERGDISAGHARAILAQPEEDRDWVLQQIVGGGLTVRDAETLKRSRGGAQSSQAASSKASHKEPIYAELEENLTRQVGTKVTIRGGDKGRLELYFYSQDELQRLLDLLGYQS